MVHEAFSLRNVLDGYTCLTRVLSWRLNMTIFAHTQNDSYVNDGAKRNEDDDNKSYKRNIPAELNWKELSKKKDPADNASVGSNTAIHDRLQAEKKYWPTLCGSSTR